MTDDGCNLHNFFWLPSCLLSNTNSDEGPQRLTIHLRRAYDVRYDIFIYLSMCSISIFWINTIRDHSCYPSSLRNHPWGLGIPHQPAIERVQWQLNVTQKIAVAIWMIGSLSVATLLFSRTIRDCVSSASSPFSLKFWCQIPVQFLPLAITSTLSTLSTPSSYLHHDTVIYYPAKQVDILNQHLYTTQFITFPSRWSGWHLWAQLGKKGFKEQLWRHVPWHAQPAKVLLRQSAGIFGTLVYMLKTALHSIRVTIYVYKCFPDC